jgi:hypothetical protein
VGTVLEVLLRYGALEVLLIGVWVVVSLAGGGMRKAEHMLAVLLPRMKVPMSLLR